MKRLLFKFFFLLILAIGVFWAERDAQVVLADYCASALFQAMGACDPPLIETINNYNDRWYLCYQQASAACSPTYDTACMNAAEDQCRTDLTNAYDSRYNNYGDCITGVGTCSYEPDYCPEAYARKDSCNAMVVETQDYTAYYQCIGAIPHREICPGFIEE